MPLSAAERAKRYRDKIKSDPVRHEEYTENERDQYKARRDRGDFDLSQKTERTQTDQSGQMFLYVYCPILS
jgi:hypothetical protein